MFNTVSQHFGIMAAFPLCTLPEGEFVPRIQTDFGKMMLYKTAANRTEKLKPKTVPPED